MKIRILGNSLRLRLSQTEVQRLLANDQVRETIMFGLDAAKQLHYTVKAVDVSEVTASFYGNEITVLIPTSQCAEWGQGDEVSIQKQIPIGTDQILKVLIEKDFKCLKDREGEEESDLFPNPDEGTYSC